MLSTARRISPRRQKVLACLAQGPLPNREIARRLDYPVTLMGAEVYNMEKAGLIKVVGTAHEAGFVAGYNATTKAFGLPDCPLLPGVVDREAARRRQLRPLRSRGGSGVIAPPPYVTGFRWGLR